MVGDISTNTFESVKQFPTANLLTDPPEVYETDKAIDSPENIHYYNLIVSMWTGARFQQELICTNIYHTVYVRIPISVWKWRIS